MFMEQLRFGEREKIGRKGIQEVLEKLEKWKRERERELGLCCFFFIFFYGYIFD